MCGHISFISCLAHNLYLTLTIASFHFASDSTQSLLKGREEERRGEEKRRNFAHGKI
jgi:hypothetical protein